LGLEGWRRGFEGWRWGLGDKRGRVENFGGAVGEWAYNACVPSMWSAAVVLLSFNSLEGNLVLLPFLIRRNLKMEDKQRFKSEMIVRCSDYGEAEADSFAADSLGGKLFADLKTLIVELNTHAAKQSSGRSSAAQGTASRESAREELREDLEAISRTARAIAEVMPGLDEKFRLPRGNATDQELLAAARASAVDAVPLKTNFIEYGMPADFLDDLDEDIEAFEVAVSAQEAGKREHVTATAAIDEVIERAMQMVRRLDAIVHNVFRDKAAKLAAWESARHVERSPRRKKQTPPPK
jgi:hypothetical protein